MNLIHITDLGMRELDVYARLNETQLVHINEPALGIFVAESPLVIGRALDGGYMPLSFLVDEKRAETDEETQRVLARCGDVPIYAASEALLSAITGFKLTRGLLCAMQRKPLPSVEALCKEARRIAILEDVVNPTNVGAIFRSAAALGMDAVLLTSACSDPLYRRAARVAMGTVFQLPWTYFDEKHSPLTEGLKQLRGMGFRSAAMALRTDSVNVDDPALRAQERLAVILGTEGTGLRAETIAASDYTVCIPMAHGVDSLNVAAASAVAFWALGR